jgi:hypothetical protein
MVEAPYAVIDNITNRKSHYCHEGKKSDYEQATLLWTRVMNERAAKSAYMSQHRKAAEESPIPREPGKLFGTQYLALVLI